MSEPNVLPVQRFSPAPAIWVDRTEKETVITGQMEMFGPEATGPRAASVQDAINTNWTQTFADGYSVRCSVTVRFRGASTPAGQVTQIEADKISGPSNVSSGFLGLGDRRMTLNANEKDAFEWTAAHEFGHVIGLQDRYSEAIMNGKRKTTANPGYRYNMMADVGGTVWSKNLKDMAVENEPSSWWINDDDQVRDWVNGHRLEDVTKLSTASKLKMFKVLIGGWISDSDVAAMQRIAASVTDAIEADAIRKGVDLSEFNSIGQRTAVRAAFNKMPQS